MASLYKSQSMSDLAYAAAGSAYDAPTSSRSNKQAPVAGAGNSGLPPLQNMAGQYDFNNIKMHDGKSNIGGGAALANYNQKP